MWEINNLDQFITVLWSLLLGALLSLLYDSFKSVRLSFHHSRVSVFFEDILFGLIGALLSFCLLMLRTKGQIRLFVFLFMIIGFVLWRLTLSRFNVKFLCLFLRFLKMIFGKVECFFEKLGQKLENFFKKFYKTAKKGLKGTKVLLYNLLKRKKSAQPNDNTTGLIKRNETKT